MTTPIAPGTIIPLLASLPNVELAGRAGYTVELHPGQRDHMYSWSPELRDRLTLQARAPAGDLDLQMMWLRANRPANNPPLVYWRIEYSHGEVLYYVPQASSLAPAGAAPPALEFQTSFGWVLPQRGLRLRLPARAFKLFLFTPPLSPPPPDPAEPGGEECTLQVSVQPCSGMTHVVLPTTDLSFVPTGVLPGRPQQMPLGATEMRFVNPVDGLSFAAGEQVQFYDVSGAPTGAPVNLVLLGNWQPIPMFAAFWVAMDAATQVSYR